MKSNLKLFGIAAIIAIAGSILPAQARSLFDGERHMIGSFGQYDCDYGNCMQPQHPQHRRHGGYIEPGFSFEFQFGNVYPRHEYYRRPMIQRVRFCTNDMAVHKARSLGIHRIRAYAYPDYILIKGKARGHHVEVSFSRARGCPVLSY